MAYISATIVDTDSKTIRLTGDDTVFIKYHSDASVTMELKNGVLNLDACVIINGSEKAYKTTHTFRDVESNKFRFSCEDSNNVSYTEDVYVNMIDYVKPTCNIASTTIDGDGNVTITCTGNSFNGSFGAVTNEIVAKCRYKLASGGSFSTWKEMNVTQYSSNYSAYASFSGLEYQKNYIFEAMVTDELEEKTAQRTISSKPVFHWGKDDFTFEVPVKATSMQVYDELRLKKANKNYGSYLYFGDGDLCYIAETSDDNMLIYAEHDIDIETGDGSVYINGSKISGEAVESGEWDIVFEEESAIGSEHYRQGWYSKVGNVVTVGFYFKAYTNAGYDDVPIVISNLPFTPIYAASGGGMCSGANVAGGNNFQCFVAETDGTITTRVQKCNNTADGNLSTSASGCCYSKNGAILTLSGTITYLTNE